MKEIKLSNFNPFTVFMDLLYNFWVIVLAAVIGFVSVGTYYDFAYEPRYKSSMTVCVNVKDSNGYVSSNITKTIEIAGVMQNMFSNNVMEEFVAENAVDFVAAKVSASVIEETNLIIITAESKSAVDAFKTLKAVYENYKTIFAENVFQDVYINTVTEPTVASGPYNAIEPRRKEILGGFGLALAVALLIIAISFLRDTVKQESDMENYVDGEFFGVVYHEKASKETIALAKKNKMPVLQSVADPFCSYVFSQSISTIATRVEYLKKTKDCKSFIFTSVDEHEGKTTISVNTALSLASKGYQTLLIDADLRRPSVYRYFPNEDEEMKYGELGDKLLGKETDNLIHYDEKTGLYFIAGKNSYKYAFELLGSEKFKELLEGMYIGFDFIIIDTPPTLLTADAEAIADNVDASILIVHQDRTPISRINDTVDMLSRADSYFAGCILNNYRTLSGFFTGERLAETKKGDGAYYYENKPQADEE